MSDPLSFSQAEMSDRVARVRTRMAALGLDALIIADAANVRYVTGFRGEPRTVFLTGDKLVLYTSFRTLPWAEQQCGALGSSIEISSSSDPLDDIRKRLSAEPKKIGTDRSVTHQALLDLQSQLPTHELLPAAAIEQVRQIKSPAEIALLEKSQRINEAIFDTTLPQIRPGMSERAVQGIILAEMAANEDVDRYAFMPIVATGPNAWEIHHLPDHTIIEQNQMLLIDLGVFYQGYASDMTRTVCFGKATEQMRENYRTVGEAQRSAIAAMRPGAGTHGIDQIARSILTDAGHGRSFTHGLGHSIGLETHDPGLNLSQKNPDSELEPGMAFTVEPGIYLENGFGVRTEDVVIVTGDGNSNITKQSSDLLELPV